MLEVACAALRQTSTHPTDFETRWQLMAADMITSSTRRGRGSAETFLPQRAEDYDRHFEHMLERDPSNPHLALRSARYEQAQFYIWRLTWGVAVIRSQVDLPSEHARRPLERAVTLLEPLLPNPDFADEARVRSADALLHLGRTEEALEHLGKPAQSGEWEYIRRLIRGHYFVRYGKVDEADLEYRAAILSRPDAGPANLALAGLRFLNGQMAQAERLAAAVSPTTSDPWLDYVYPGGNGLNERLAALRLKAHDIQ
ncbi:MAG TPA: hypothetical protein VGD94_15880 [Vicinamibacterales bacterium]